MLMVNSLNRLPKDLLPEIADFLDGASLAKIGGVSKEWMKLTEWQWDAMSPNRRRWKLALNEFMPLASPTEVNVNERLCYIDAYLKKKNTTTKKLNNLFACINICLGLGSNWLYYLPSKQKVKYLEDIATYACNKIGGAYYIKKSLAQTKNLACAVLVGSDFCRMDLLNKKNMNYLLSQYFKQKRKDEQYFNLIESSIQRWSLEKMDLIPDLNYWADANLQAISTIACQIAHTGGFGAFLCRSIFEEIYQNSSSYIPLNPIAQKVITDNWWAIQNFIPNTVNWKDISLLAANEIACNILAFSPSPADFCSNQSVIESHSRFNHLLYTSSGIQNYTLKNYTTEINNWRDAVEKFPLLVKDDMLLGNVYGMLATGTIMVWYADRLNLSESEAQAARFGNPHEPFPRDRLLNPMQKRLIRKVHIIGGLFIFLSGTALYCNDKCLPFYLTTTLTSGFSILKGIHPSKANKISLYSSHKVGKTISQIQSAFANCYSILTWLFNKVLRA